MITRIRMQNVYSIGDIDIDFTKAKYGYKKEMIYNSKYINPLAIYGFNGSGKSSFINALGFIVSLMNEGETMEITPNYLLASKLKKEHLDYPYLISKIILNFMVNNNSYEYLLILSSGSILKEELTLNQKRILERNKDFYTTYLHYIKSDNLKLKNKSILLELKDEFLEAYDYLSNIIYIADHRTNSISRVLLDSDIYHVFTKYSQDIKNILSEIPNTFTYEIIKEDNEYYVLYDDEEKLPIKALSNGMFNLSLIFSLLLATPEDGILVIDEIERGLHPFVLEKILEIINQKRIQLIFSSQNTHLMSLLRPDQIYFASFKGFKTEFERLSNLEGNIREVNNIEKMYLSNNFSK